MDRHAEQNRWNAYRYPTDAEISRGREEHDVFWVGAEIDKHAAQKIIAATGGQIQFGLDGEVEGVSAP